MKEKTFDVDITLHDESAVKADGDALQMFHSETITRLEENGKTTLIPYHAIVKETYTESEKEVEYTDDTCVQPEPTKKVTVTIEGAENTVINKGDSFDVMSGVSATDSDGNTVEVTADPTEIDTDTVGNKVVTYTAGDTYVTRTITVKE